MTVSTTTTSCVQCIGLIANLAVVIVLYFTEYYTVCSHQSGVAYLLRPNLCV